MKKIITGIVFVACSCNVFALTAREESTAREAVIKFITAVNEEDFHAVTDLLDYEDIVYMTGFLDQFRGHLNRVEQSHPGVLDINLPPKTSNMRQDCADTISLLSQLTQNHDHYSLKQFFCGDESCTALIDEGEKVEIYEVRLNDGNWKIHEMNVQYASQELSKELAEIFTFSN